MEYRSAPDLTTVRVGSASGAFDAVHYDLEVTYDVATHTIEGVASYTALWRGADPLVDLYFFLPPNTLSRPDPHEPAVFSALRYPYGLEAATLAVSTVSDEEQHPPTRQRGTASGWRWRWTASRRPSMTAGRSPQRWPACLTKTTSFLTILTQSERGMLIWGGVHS